ncbi:hypothetical protein AMJ82_02255 [candidate division TA06 bacterium SM23_40]|uniref:Uncharacterized protein n=1 Tax=candidate division TA06 bacterium SM23_40 TaxID=1703774 RepID=A0A0S8GDL9_UNCT6|nr:MAG: hypothetical protein AMJ82_02255 [candidate division TA06 bacterium SM23_40]
MVADVVLMEEDASVVEGETFHLAMAGEALLTRHSTVSSRHRIVTLLAGKPTGHDLPVIVSDPPAGPDLLRRPMTRGTTRHRLPGLHPFEMAEKTGRLSNSDVLALYDLRMAGRAAQNLSSPELGQVWAMGEQYRLELNSPSEEPFVVAPLSETTCVLDLCYRLRLVCVQHIGDEL